MAIIKHPSGPIPSVSGQSGNLLSTNGNELVWSAPAASGGMTVLASGNLSGINTLTLSSISQTYVNLRLVLRNVSAASNTFPQMRLNNNATGLYTYNYLNAASVGGPTGNSGVQLAIHNLDFTTTTNNFVIDINDYKTTGGVNYTSLGLYMATSGTVYAHNVFGGFETLGTAVSRIDIINNSSVNWDAGSYILYGVK